MTKKILAVDDSSTNIALLSGILQEEGYHVITANNGKEAIQKLLTAEVDLILLDLMMPQLNGFKFLEKLRALEGKKDIPVIVVSAKTASKSIKKALELGANDFIKKPIDIQKLIDKVENFVSQS